MQSSPGLPPAPPAPPPPPIPPPPSTVTHPLVPWQNTPLAESHAPQVATVLPSGKQKNAPLVSASHASPARALQGSLVTGLHGMPMPPPVPPPSLPTPPWLPVELELELAAPMPPWPPPEPPLPSSLLLVSSLLQPI